MPSPFPGMDPYLEEPSQWPDVHLLRVGEHTVACPKKNCLCPIARYEPRPAAEAERKQ
jgi:hypothetical protein